MNFEAALENYRMLQDAVDTLDREVKEKKAELNKKLLMLEQWITAKAQEDGLENVKVAGVGTVYWSTHQSATVADRGMLFDHCKENDTWDLIESRVSKNAVKSYLEAHGELPPGVTYKTNRVFNFRRASVEAGV